MNKMLIFTGLLTIGALSCTNENANFVIDVGAAYNDTIGFCDQCLNGSSDYRQTYCRDNGCVVMACDSKDGCNQYADSNCLVCAYEFTNGTVGNFNSAANFGGMQNYNGYDCPDKWNGFLTVPETSQAKISDVSRCDGVVPKCESANYTVNSKGICGLDCDKAAQEGDLPDILYMKGALDFDTCRLENPWKLGGQSTVGCKSGEGKCVENSCNPCAYKEWQPYKVKPGYCSHDYYTKCYKFTNSAF